jgi:hypothetical protein
LVVAAALLCVFGTACAVLLIPGDPWADAVVARGFGHDTRYAPGYREDAWWRLRRGPTTGDVAAILGAPLRKTRYDAHREVWSYTDSPRGSDYWMRAVSFRDGAAEEFRGGFYRD